MIKEDKNTGQSEISQAAVRTQSKPVKMKKKEKLKIHKKDLNLWYDNVDVMHILKISESTLARYRKNQKIPFTKLGSKYFYPRQFFEDSMAAKMENKHLLK
jgi:hypothetical protein